MRTALVVALLVVVAAVTAYVVWPRESDLEQATALLPDSTLRVAWTDWAGLREEYDASDVAPTGQEADAFVAELTDNDRVSASPTAAIAADLHSQLGWSPLTSDWEMLGQGHDGMVLVVDLGEDADLSDVADHYADAGFTAPEGDRLDGGVWTAGADVLAGLTNLGDPVLQHVALLEDEHLLVSSDSAAYLRAAVPVARGDEDGLDLSALTGHVEDPLAAVGFVDDYACEELAMAAADEGAQAQAAQLVAAAGGVSPLAGYLVALQPDDRMTVVFAFESDGQADDDATSRRRLAEGEDPGQLLAYPDLFHVADSEADGSEVVLGLEDVAEDGYALTNLTQGPVLLASC
jgi:hypothetical protein